MSNLDFCICYIYRAPHLDGAVAGAGDETAPTVVEGHRRDLLRVMGVGKDETLDPRLDVPHGQHRVVRPRYHLSQRHGYSNLIQYVINVTIHSKIKLLKIILRHNVKTH